MVFSHEQDLYIWQEPDQAITSFQLCYGKPSNERALSWRTDTGFSHTRVEEGRHAGTPLMVADANLDVDEVLGRFQHLGVNMPADIRAFVQYHLMRYPKNG